MSHSDLFILSSYRRHRTIGSSWFLQFTTAGEMTGVLTKTSVKPINQVIYLRPYVKDFVTVTTILLLAYFRLTPSPNTPANLINPYQFDVKIMIYGICKEFVCTCMYSLTCSYSHICMYKLCKKFSCYHQILNLGNDSYYNFKASEYKHAHSCL